MKVELEPEEIGNRGFFVISETEEEKEVLDNIWKNRGSVVMLGRMSDGQLQLAVAPASK